MKDFNEQSAVELIGLHDNADSIEKSRAMDTAQNYLSKLERITKRPTRLVVHVKMHEVEGKRKKFSVHTKLSAPGVFLEASHEEWDLLSAVQRSLAALEKEVIKKFKR